MLASDRWEMCTMVRRLVSNYVGQWITFLIYRVTQKKNRTHIFLSEIHKFHSSCLTVMMTSGSSKTGGPPHTSNHTLDWLRKRFQERLISRKWDVESAPHSPDLKHTPPPPPRFLTVGVSEGQCVSEQSSNNR